MSHRQTKERVVTGAAVVTLWITAGEVNMLLNLGDVPQQPEIWRMFR
jgi:hypothetical protein